MSTPFELVLAACLRELSREDRRWLEDHHCGVLLSIRFGQVDMDFLYAAMRHYDHDIHCFTFRSNELIPLPEELGAIINWPNHELPCLPRADDHFYQDFRDYLGMDSNAIKKIVHGRSVDLVLFVEYFMSSDPSRRLFRRRALMFCLFARLLFVHRDLSRGHASLVAVIQQCEQGRNPMPLVTGELFVALDEHKRDPMTHLTGCPLLLQLWLMEHLQLIEPPVSRERYNPRGILTRRRIHGSVGPQAWVRILTSRETLIRWTVPWWEITTMVDGPRSTHIQVASLLTLTYYYHTRARRQYGQRQEIPDVDHVRASRDSITDASVRAWEIYWQRRPRTSVQMLAPGDARLSRPYIAWSTSSSLMGRYNARLAELRRPSGVPTTYPTSDARGSSVKDRLGSRMVPVWERLEKVSPSEACSSGGRARERDEDGDERKKKSAKGKKKRG